jgi:hypothetical protein
MTGLSQGTNRAVPEYIGYTRASQVWAVEPSFIETKRLAVSESREFCKLRILCEICSRK